MQKILVAEDDQLVSNSLCQALTEAGYEAHASYDGEDALVKVKELNPSIVLLDIMMPKLDGLSVLWELKANDKTSQMPVVVLTNIADVDTISKIIQGGANDYLLKSEQSVEQVVNKIKEVLGRLEAAKLAPNV